MYRSNERSRFTGILSLFLLLVGTTAAATDRIEFTYRGQESETFSLVHLENQLFQDSVEYRFDVKVRFHGQIKEELSWVLSLTGDGLIALHEKDPSSFSDRIEVEARVVHSEQSPRKVRAEIIFDVHFDRYGGSTEDSHATQERKMP